MLDVDAIFARSKRPAPPDTPEHRAWLAFMAELRRVSELPWAEKQRDLGDPAGAYQQAKRAYEQIAGLSAVEPAGSA